MLKNWNFERLFTTFHMSRVMCHMSHVTCHMTCEHIFFSFSFWPKWRKLIGGGSVIIGQSKVVLFRSNTCPNPSAGVTGCRWKTRPCDPGRAELTLQPNLGWEETREEVQTLPSTNGSKTGVHMKNGANLQIRILPKFSLAAQVFGGV